MTLNSEQLQALTQNWSLVVQAHMEAVHSTRLDFVPKGDPDSLTTLLANWGQAIPNTYPVPTEAQLLNALSIVEAEIAADEMVQSVQSGAEAQAAAIPGFATWTESEGLTWIDDNIGNGAIAAVTNLAEAKDLMVKQAVAFRALWRVSKALLNHTWPNLEGS
jgi:hypothetical protein